MGVPLGSLKLPRGGSRVIRIGMGVRLESPNIPRGAGDGGARGLVLVDGWVDSWDLPIYHWEQGD